MPTPDSSAEEMLAYWKALIGDDSPRAWAPEDTAMLFQCFRPHGDGVEAVFEGVVGGEEILERLREVYAVTAEGWQTEESTDYYFIVRRPQPLAAARAAELCRTWLANVIRICDEFAGEDEWLAPLRKSLDPVPPIKVVQGTQPWPPGEDSPEGDIYEVMAEFLPSLESVESHANLLGEAFYTIACDYYISDHLRWALYRDSCPVEEPLQPYFELWKYGPGTVLARTAT